MPAPWLPLVALALFKSGRGPPPLAPPSRAPPPLRQGVSMASDPAADAAATEALLPQHAVAASAAPSLPRELAGEAVGTFVLMVLGGGVLCTAQLSPLAVDLFHVAVAWGASVTVAIAVCGGASASHFNPAVTVAMATFNGFPRRKLAPYVCAQLLGATLASLLLALTWRAALASADHLPFALAFGDAPGAAVARSWLDAACTEAWATALLVYAILAVPAGPAKPALIGATVTMLILAVGALTGACLNPARDLGPRLVAAAWRLGPPAARSCAQSAAYCVGPLVGGLLGGAAHWLVSRL